MRRRDFLTGLALCASLLYAGRALAQAEVLVGYLTHCDPNDFHAVTQFHVGHLRRRLCALGWCGAREARILVRAGNTPSLLAEAAADLVRSKVKVIVADGASSASAAKQATSRIPIVFTYAAGPVTRRLVASLSRPEGNLTGFAVMDETMPKLLEFIREAQPAVRRVAYFFDPANTPQDVLVQQAAEYTALAAATGLEYREIAVRNLAEIEAALPAAKAKGVDVVIVESSNLFFVNRFVVTEVALRHRLPVLSRTTQFGRAGGLISYGENIIDLQERTATYVDRLLRGARVSELPVQQATTLQLVINARTARLLGIEIPPSLLSRADEVITEEIME